MTPASGGDRVVPSVSVGWASDIGPRRKRNEDFAGAVLAEAGEAPANTGERADVALAIADGMGGARGGRVAAETAVRGFLDGLADLPPSVDVRQAGARVLVAINAWLHAQGRQDRTLAGMGCTFTGLVLRGRQMHVLHAGDSRAWRLTDGRLALLTVDHAREGPNGSRVLTRALGAEAEIRLDYASVAVDLHDRFLLSSDGVHAALEPDTIADLLGARSTPTDTAQALIAAAFERGSTDNATALVLDVLALPELSPDAVGKTIAGLPIGPTPLGGEVIDGFRLGALVSDGPFSRLFAATDEQDGATVVLKFPKPVLDATRGGRDAFAREFWVGQHVASPHLVRTVALPPERQTRLYTVMPLYTGETLDARLARRPALGLEEGRRIGVRLARGALALHRAGVIHRDIKPANVMLEAEGGVRLLDLGAVRLPGLEPGTAEAAPRDVPGTRAFVAPELLRGAAGDARTDVFALAVTLFRAWSGAFPFGNADATAPPSRDRPMELAALRPDLPSWLGAALDAALAVDERRRPPDMAAFAAMLEAGPPTAAPPPRPRTLYERAPVRVWQAIALILAAALVASLTLR